MRRVLVVVRLVLALAVAAAGLVATASPCRACSCVPRTPKQIVEEADASFVGTVVASRPLSDTRIVQTFDVRETFGGVLPERVDVVSDIGPDGGSSCALLFPAGGVVAVAVTEDADGAYTTSSCSYLSVAELRRVGGVALEPAPVPPSTTQGPGPTGASEPARPNPFVVAGLGLIVGTALIGAWLRWSTRGHGRSDEAGEEPEEGGDLEEDV